MNTLTRSQAIHAIRKRLLEMVDDEHSMCQVAAEQGVFCRGFGRYTDEQLRDRYDWLLKKNPEMTRKELEDLANRWQIARQVVNRVPIACDAQSIERDTCQGWDEFDNGTLADYYRQLMGEEVTISR